MLNIRERLGLYQVFVKLYEHNRDLLDEILQSTNLCSDFFQSFVPQYIIGVVQQRQVYLITNLTKGQTQTIFNPQKIWTIGRGSSSTVLIPDHRLSRNHATIKYIENQGFYLSDLHSTNGTSINQKSISEPVLLKDGDRIRLGCFTFSFFVCEDSSLATTNNLELDLAKLEVKTDADDTLISHNLEVKPLFNTNLNPSVTTEQKRHILDRFLEQERQRRYLHRS
jgi:pSer/pThr/pTyr-binding forkhead associated (FHA) protein